MIRTRFLALATAAGIALSAAAFAQQAFTTRTANVRAGPAPDFPVVVTLPPGAQVNVAGCVDDYRWCDVDFGGGRGWLNTRALQTYYGDRLVPLYGYGANIGFPIVTFSLFDYWDNFYRNRPFYRDRPRFEQRWGGYRGYDRRPGNAYVQPRPEYRQDYRQFDRQRPQMDRQQFDRQQFDRQHQPQVQQRPNEPYAGRPGMAQGQQQFRTERPPQAQATPRPQEQPRAPQAPQGRPAERQIERAQPNTDQGR